MYSEEAAMAPGIPRISRPRKPLRKRLNPTELELVFRGALTEVNLPKDKRRQSGTRKGSEEPPRWNGWHL